MELRFQCTVIVNEESPMNSCLITGAGGFIGSHLSELMVEKGWAVHGTVHRSSQKSWYLPDKVCVLKTDIRDALLTRALVAEVKPDVIFHLASQTYIQASWENPEDTLATNILGTLNLLEAVRSADLNPIVIVAGSSAEYGSVGSCEGLISEEQAFRPGSPYAVSKIGEDMLAYSYWRRHGLRIIRVRPFALIGPRKLGDAVSDFARGIVRVEQGKADCLSVGNLDSIRDFIDVRDGAKALALLAERGQSGEVYNICAGEGRALKEVVDELVAASNGPVTIVADPKRMRPSDDSVLVGDNRKLRDIGWEPQITLRQTLIDTLAFWRSASLC